MSESAGATEGSAREAELITADHGSSQIMNVSWRRTSFPAVGREGVGGAVGMSIRCHASGYVHVRERVITLSFEKALGILWSENFRFCFA